MGLGCEVHHDIATRHHCRDGLPVPHVALEEVQRARVECLSAWTSRTATNAYTTSKKETFRIRLHHGQRAMSHTHT